MTRRRTKKLAIASAAAITLAAAIGSQAYAADVDCRTVRDREEIRSLKKGDIIYGDIAAKIRIRIASIDVEAKEICGRTRKGDRCFQPDKVYTGAGLAECGRGSALGAILLFGDKDKDTAAEQAGGAEADEEDDSGE